MPRKILFTTWKKRQERRQDKQKQQEAENPEHREQRLHSLAEHASTSREHENVEEKRIRIAAIAERASAVRAGETVDQRRARLRRDRMQRRRSSLNKNASSHRAALTNNTDAMVPLYNVGGMTFKCLFCGAFNFEGEKVGSNYAICCHQGKISLPPLRVPDMMRELFERNDGETRSYLESIRNYNSAFAFASLGAQIDPPPGHGPYTFRIHGQIYHYVGGLHPLEGTPPSYASLYILDAQRALEERLSFPTNAECSREMMAKLQAMLNDANPHVQLFRHAHEIEQEAMAKAQQDGVPITSVRMFIRKSADRRRFNDPRAEEIAAVFIAPDGEPPGPRDIVVHSKAEGLTKISVLNPCCDPFTYPLLFPYGEFGFEPDMMHVVERATKTRNKVTILQFYCYRLAIRSDFSLLHSSGKLFQQYVVDAYVKWEGNNLSYIRENQPNLRIERYQGLLDHINTDGQEAGLRPGRPVILPSSFIGSPRNMQQNFQDAMAIVGKFGKPDLFITFTCNPKWTEIRSNVKPWEHVENRPDLLSRVFSLKLKEFMEDLTKRHVFGIVKAYLYVIEFQKRGLPHAHILLILAEDDKIREVEDIDCTVCAEIPDISANPRLHEIIKSCMIHGPCGRFNPSSPCMEENKCTKRYPKDFAPETKANVDGYPVYRRRDDGATLRIRGVDVDNTWVVPYNPYLSLKYDAHINVEICASIKSIKYLFKYIYKGYDCASVQIQQRVPEENEDGVITYNEIDTFLEARYVSAPESVWRLHENHMHQQSHTIKRLAVHLPLEQTVCFLEGEEREAAERAASSDTTLTAWFKLNQEDASAREIKYQDIPTHYVWVDKGKKWKTRERGGDNMIGRLYSASPKDCERYFLRMLLLHVMGATSFEDVRTVEGVVCESFREAAIRRGLLADDREWRACFQEASVLAMPRQMRQMYAYICVFCTPTSPAQLFNEFREHFCEDYLRRTGDEQGSINLALADIHDIVVSNGMDYAKLGLPNPQVVRSPDDVIDMREEQRLSEELTRQLNGDQRTIVEEILLCVREQTGGSFFIDGPGGTGKTFVYECLIHTLRSERRHVLSVAWTGIAANLMTGGRTAHSAFKFPIPLVENSVSNMAANSTEAQKLRETSLIIWDEASMAPSTAVDVLDRLLRDVCGNDQLFGGKVVLFGGDFRQVLPVVRHGNKTSIIEACMKRSQIWPSIQTRHLTVNMRTTPAEENFAAFLLQLGNGDVPTNEEISSFAVRLPDECILQGEQDIIHQVFGPRITAENISTITECAILCPKNSDCDFINNQVVETRLEGAEREYCSADTIVSDDQDEINNYPMEFINSLNPSGMPPHKLRLKVGTVCMLIRNIDVKRGLVNGCRVVVRHLHNTTIDVEVLTGQGKGTRVLLPRMDLTTSDPTMPFVIKRRQFPIRLAFAMTINKAQGQTFRRIGLYLPQPVFAHGQLYVAFSRVRRLSDIKVQVNDTKQQGKFTGKEGTYTSNVVYQEVLR